MLIFFGNDNELLDTCKKHSKYKELIYNLIFSPKNEIWGVFNVHVRL